MAEAGYEKLAIGSGFLTRAASLPAPGRMPSSRRGAARKVEYSLPSVVALNMRYASAVWRSLSRKA